MDKQCWFGFPVSCKWWISVICCLIAARSFSISTQSKRENVKQLAPAESCFGTDRAINSTVGQANTSSVVECLATLRQVSVTKTGDHFGSIVPPMPQDDDETIELELTDEIKTKLARRPIVKLGIFGFEFTAWTNLWTQINTSVAGVQLAYMDCLDRSAVAEVLKRNSIVDNFEGLDGQVVVEQLVMAIGKDIVKFKEHDGEKDGIVSFGSLSSDFYSKKPIPVLLTVSQSREHSTCFSVLNLTWTINGRLVRKRVICSYVVDNSPPDYFRWTFKELKRYPFDNWNEDGSWVIFK